MADEDTEILDWGDEEGSWTQHAAQGGVAAQEVDDREDVVSLDGGDDDLLSFNKPSQAQVVEQSPVATANGKPVQIGSPERPSIVTEEVVQLTQTTPSSAPPPTNNLSFTSTTSRGSSGNSKRGRRLVATSSSLSLSGSSHPSLPAKPSVEITAAAAAAARDYWKRDELTAAERIAVVHSRKPVSRDVALPPDWEPRISRTGNGDTYYYNKKTQQTTWNRPMPPVPGTPPRNNSPRRDHRSRGEGRDPDIEDGDRPSGRSRARDRSKDDTRDWPTTWMPSTWRPEDDNLVDPPPPPKHRAVANEKSRPANIASLPPRPSSPVERPTDRRIPRSREQASARDERYEPQRESRPFDRSEKEKRDLSPRSRDYHRNEHNELDHDWDKDGERNPDHSLSQTVTRPARRARSSSLDNGRDKEYVRRSDRERSQSPAISTRWSAAPVETRPPQNSSRPLSTRIKSASPPHRHERRSPSSESQRPALDHRRTSDAALPPRRTYGPQDDAKPPRAYSPEPDNNNAKRRRTAPDDGDSATARRPHSERATSDAGADDASFGGEPKRKRAPLPPQKQLFYDMDKVPFPPPAVVTPYGPKAERVRGIKDSVPTLPLGPRVDRAHPHPTTKDASHPDFANQSRPPPSGPSRRPVEIDLDRTMDEKDRDYQGPRGRRGVPVVPGWGPAGRERSPPPHMVTTGAPKFNEQLPTTVMNAREVEIEKDRIEAMVQRAARLAKEGRARSPEPKPKDFETTAPPARRTRWSHDPASVAGKVSGSNDIPVGRTRKFGQVEDPESPPMVNEDDKRDDRRERARERGATQPERSPVARSRFSDRMDTDNTLPRSLSYRNTVNPPRGGRLSGMGDQHEGFNGAERRPVEREKREASPLQRDGSEIPGSSGNGIHLPRNPMDPRDTSPAGHYSDNRSNTDRREEPRVNRDRRRGDERSGRDEEPNSSGRRRGGWEEGGGEVRQGGDRREKEEGRKEREPRERDRGGQYDSDVDYRQPPSTRRGASPIQAPQGPSSLPERPHQSYDDGEDDYATTNRASLLQRLSLDDSRSKDNIGSKSDPDGGVLSSSLRDRIENNWTKLPAESRDDDGRGGFHPDDSYEQGNGSRRRGGKRSGRGGSRRGRR